MEIFLILKTDDFLTCFMQNILLIFASENTWRKIYLMKCMSSNSSKLIIQSRYVVVWNSRIHHQDHLDFVKHLINVYLLKKIHIGS